MPVVYYDNQLGYGVNAYVAGDWDFYHSMAELANHVDSVLGENVVYIPSSLPVGTQIVVEDLTRD